MRKDVPGVFGDDAGGEEVNFAGKVGNDTASGVTANVEMVEALDQVGGAFDLDAPERSSETNFANFARVDDGVVTFAVSVGLGDAEAEGGGFEGEGEFGEFSAALGVEFAEDGWIPTLRKKRGRVGPHRF
jgi:hypothetical protein